MNPISRFIYLNMNYHVEHHMFPMVPYHALPRLHELIKHDLPAANPSMWHAYKEMIPVLLRQLRNEDYFLTRVAAEGAALSRETCRTPLRRRRSRTRIRREPTATSRGESSEKWPDGWRLARSTR